MRLLGRRLVAPQLERRERTNRDVVSVRIPERELPCSSIRVRVRLLFESGETSARALFSDISKSSTRKNKRSPLPGVASSRLINDGCSCAPHWSRQSKTVPSESTSDQNRH